MRSTIHTRTTGTWHYTVCMCTQPPVNTQLCGTRTIKIRNVVTSEDGTSSAQLHRRVGAFEYLYFQHKRLYKIMVCDEAYNSSISTGHTWAAMCCTYVRSVDRVHRCRSSFPHSVLSTYLARATIGSSRLKNFFQMARKPKNRQKYILALENEYLDVGFMPRPWVHSSGCTFNLVIILIGFSVGYRATQVKSLTKTMVYLYRTTCQIKRPTFAEEWCRASATKNEFLKPPIFVGQS